MIKVTLTNEILKRITAINENRFSLSKTCMPAVTRNRLRKNSKKKSSYASNKTGLREIRLLKIRQARLLKEILIDTS